MLPLWIIDLTQKSDRRDEFQRLVGKIHHTFIPEDIRLSSVRQDTNGQSSTEENLVVNALEEHVAIAGEGRSAGGVKQRTVAELLESEEREEAARNAIIKGNYWYYSQFDFDEFFDCQRLDGGCDMCTVAKDLYAFQEALVKTAKDFIRELRRSNAKPYQTFNVVVLGDSSELLTQLVFASMAIILQKEKGRFLPGHIHQGMSVIGMLYVPCDVNTYAVDERTKILRLLKEIDVQHNATLMRGYDNMMLYQDVQNRTECVYPQLDQKQQAEYLIQCLAHLYLACDINHPMIQGTGADETFYFSMGASSIFFDMTVEDKKDADKVALELLNAFKAEGENNDAQLELRLLDESLYKASVFVKQFNVDKIDLDVEPAKPVSPHPILDYMHRNLKRLYYNYHLKFFPAEMLRDILHKVEDSTNKQLNAISAYCLNSYKSAEVTILPAITRVISKVNEHNGALSFLENQLRDMQECMSKEKDEIQKNIEYGYWHALMYEKKMIPKRQMDHFEDYHDAYTNDVRSKNGGAGCHNMRDEAIANLKRLLSTEKTTLAVLSRCFLLGIMLVLGLLPLLDLMSPSYVDLGNVHDNAFYWAAALFMIPVLWQFIAYLLYIRKRDVYIRLLKAYYTHDAYARIANRMEFEAVTFFDKMIELLDEYITRCKRIRKEVNIITPNPNLETLFPESMFNQPLNGGKFGEDYLIPKSEIEGCRIRVNYQPNPVNSLTKSHYYILINKFNDEIAGLFRDVYVTEKHARRFDENIGDYVFVSKEVLEQEKEKAWASHKEDFRKALLKSIKSEMIPREYPTVGDKLIQYKKKIDKLDLLEPMIAYAATNGEVCSDSNTEFADVKMNRDIGDLVVDYLPLYTTRMQMSKYDEIYQKCVFVTRWKCFDKLALNRLFPKEDFDQATREERVYADEMKAKARKKKEEDKKRGVKRTEPEQVEYEGMQEYKPVISSVILWSVCPDDNSSEWLKLFEVEHFSKAFEDRKQFREIMNQND